MVHLGQEIPTFDQSERQKDPTEADGEDSGLPRGEVERWPPYRFQNQLSTRLEGGTTTATLRRGAEDV